MKQKLTESLGLFSTLWLLAGEGPVCACRKLHTCSLACLHNGRFESKTTSLFWRALKMRHECHLKIRLSEFGQKSYNHIEKLFRFQSWWSEDPASSEHLLLKSPVFRKQRRSNAWWGKETRSEVSAQWSIQMSYYKVVHLRFIHCF